MSREREWMKSSSDGGRVLVNDISDLENFKGHYWVEFQNTSHGKFYTIEIFEEDEFDEAKEKAKEVANVMNIP